MITEQQRRDFDEAADMRTRGLALVEAGRLQALKILPEVIGRYGKVDTAERLGVSRQTLDKWLAVAWAMRR